MSRRCPPPLKEGSEYVARWEQGARTLAELDPDVMAWIKGKKPPAPEPKQGKQRAPSTTRCVLCLVLVGGFYVGFLALVAVVASGAS